MKCKKCRKKVNVLELFSGDLCLKCYEKEYEKLPKRDKKPVFDKSLIRVWNFLDNIICRGIVLSVKVLRNITKDFAGSFKIKYEKCKIVWV